MNTPWYKNWKIWLAVFAVLVIIGLLMPSNDKEETTTPSALCDQSQVTIAPELSTIVDTATIPDGGHIQTARYRETTDGDGVEVSFDICTPATGDELADIAETIAIEVKAADFGPTVTTMGVKSLPDDTAPGSILRDTDFRAHTHDGKAAAGATHAQWTPQN